MFLTLLNNVVRCISGHASSCENYVVVQLLSRVQLFVTPLTAARQAPLSSTVSQGCSSSCPLSQWCYLTISSSAAPFSFCPWSFPVQFSCSVISEHLRPHGPQQDRLPCPSPTPGACSNSCPLNQWCLCRPLLLLPSIFPNTRVFSNESVLHISWPKYWSFSFSMSPSSEYSGLIAFGVD